jgi:hypothetical protein
MERVRVEAKAPHYFEGWLLKTAPNGRTWTRRFVVVNPMEKTLTYCVDEKKEVKGIIDLRGATLRVGVGSDVAALVGSAIASDTPGFHLTTRKVGEDGGSRVFTLVADSMEGLQVRRGGSGGRGVDCGCVGRSWAVVGLHEQERQDRQPPNSLMPSCFHCPSFVPSFPLLALFLACIYCRNG